MGWVEPFAIPFAGKDIASPIVTSCSRESPLEVR